MAITTLRTRQGAVSGAVHIDKRSSSCIPRGASALLTKCGKLVPRSEADPPRFPETPPVTTFEDGGVRSIVLAESTQVTTPLGTLPAEKLTFYPDGNLRRLFPVAGRTNAYWTEDQEGEVCPEIALNTPLGTITARFVSILFYPDGSLRSFALWPGVKLELLTPQGPILCRFGVSFHPGGTLRSVEPARPTLVQTPIGDIWAFDGTAIGIHGDIASLQFSEDGEVMALQTEESVVDVKGLDGKVLHHAPQLVPSMCSDNATDWQPLRIRFEKEGVLLGTEFVEFSSAILETRTPSLGRAKRLPMMCT
jgi:hypothetical protein